VYVSNVFGTDFEFRQDDPSQIDENKAKEVNLCVPKKRANLMFHRTRPKKSGGANHGGRSKVV
jgi:hypothetical protein